MAKVNEPVTLPCLTRNDDGRRCRMITTLWPSAVGALAVVVLVTAMAACTSPHQYIDVTCSKMAGDTILDREAAIQCQTFRRAEAATAVYNEVSLLMKSYRACLAKYEQTPNRAKENCWPV